jgi:hypothetical protein
MNYIVELIAQVVSTERKREPTWRVDTGDGSWSQSCRAAEAYDAAAQYRSTVATPSLTARQASQRRAVSSMYSSSHRPPRGRWSWPTISVSCECRPLSSAAARSSAGNEDSPPARPRSSSPCARDEKKAFMASSVVVLLEVGNERQLGWVYI